MRQDFSTTYEDSIWSIFKPWETGYYITAPREQNAIKMFSLSHKKIPLCIFSLCAKWVKSCPNSVNIGSTWKKFKIISFYPRSNVKREKTSHATVPLIWFLPKINQSASDKVIFFLPVCASPTQIDFDGGRNSMKKLPYICVLECSDFDFFHILRYNHPSLTP